MRNTIAALAIAALSVGCASDRSLTGPRPAVGTTASLIRVHSVSRCGQGSGWGYLPYYVVNGRVYEPGEEAAIARLPADEITSITILKGDAAAREYGATAGIVGVVVITMRDHRTLEEAGAR